MKEDGTWGFDQYEISWSNKRKNFELFAFKSKFFGFYRNERDRNSDYHHIDIFIDIKSRHPLGKKKHELSVISIPYEADPREDMRSLRSDICAAINQWSYQRCTGGVMYEDLVKHLTTPTLHIDTTDMLVDVVEKLNSIMQVGGKGVIKIGDTALIIDTPPNKETITQPIRTVSKAQSNVTQDMIDAYNRFIISGETDNKKLRKKLRRLGWVGGLLRFKECLEGDSAP